MSGDGLPLILASASARRRKILSELGVRFTVEVPEVDEVALDGDPQGAAMANAERKSAWCRVRHPDCLIVAADTVIDLDGRCIGKPDSAAGAAGLLRLLAGREHRVITGMALYAPEVGVEVDAVVSSVRFKPLREADISAYFDRVHPMDKAGAYDIDQASELIIESYTGSRTNIMGLPRERVGAWLRRHGVTAAGGGGA